MERRENSSIRVTDERLEGIIGDLLGWGVFVAGVAVFLGGIAYLMQHHADVVSYSKFHPGSPDLRSITGIFKSAFQMHADAIVQLGLVLLILTPIVRVGVALVGFSLQRDRLYVIISLIVLSVLVFSIQRAV